jgi:CRISPR-associated protein Csb1
MASDPPATLSLDQLQAAVKKASAFRCRNRLQAEGGDGGKVFPPTYAGGVYAVEDRNIEGRVVRCVLLDSVQSQANRMEEVLLETFLPNWRELQTGGDDPRCDLPVVAVHVEKHGWVTSFTAPHRIHDAILRDSEIEQIKRDSQGNPEKDEQGNVKKGKKRFRDSEIGKDIVSARLWNSTAFYRYCPTALLFGTWDSTAGEGLDSAKIPRAVVSEIIGVDITPGVRTGSRLDPLGIKAQSATIYRRTDRDWALKNDNGGWLGAEEIDIDKDKQGNAKKVGKGKPSDINHGNVTPDLARFEKPDKKLSRLPDILESHPLKLRFDVEADNGRLESRTAIEGETMRVREDAVKPGGVTLPYALHTWTLSLTQLRRLRFPATGQTQTADQAGKRDEAIRTVLAALGLYAFALLRASGCWLRSRCELVPQSEGEGCPASLELINVDGKEVKFIMPDVATAKQLLMQASEKARTIFNANTGEAKPTQEAIDPERLPNPGWEQKVFRLTPTEKLAELVRRSDALTADPATEEQEAAGAGNPN